MPELIEQMYCSQQIVIPPKYPYILKRFCKAAIKTQPYDLLRWAFEYFKALAEHRPPPVKLRLEYPLYSTEGGLTRGCLKVLAHQLFGMMEIPIPILKQAWQGFCLDPIELTRILCLCEVYKRQDSVQYFHFLAVAGGMLTKCLTHTMILLCESLTKEPDGGSAAIPLNDFLIMYKFLACMDASKDVKYLDGYREGYIPQVEETVVEEHSDQSDRDGQGGKESNMDSSEDDGYWDSEDLQKLTLTNDRVARTARLSLKLTLPPIGKIERSPSIERMQEIERETFTEGRIVRPERSLDVDNKLRAISLSKQDMSEMHEATPAGYDAKPKEDVVVEKKGVEIFVFDEEEQEVQYEIYGEPKAEAEEEEDIGEEEGIQEPIPNNDVEKPTDEEIAVRTESTKVAAFLDKIYQNRQERLHDLEMTFDEITAIVDKCNTASYDLGMVAGRQMSITSGEFIVQNIEKEIMDYIDGQIAVLPDPDLKKKKAKPEEVEMVRDLLETFLDDNMDIIVPEIEEVEEEELPIPEITMVYAVPGIGCPVDDELIADFVDYATTVSKVQADLMMPRNIRHFLCPPLEMLVEHNYAAFDVPENKSKESIQEEVTTGGGVITD